MGTAGETELGPLRTQEMEAASRSEGRCPALVVGVLLGSTRGAQGWVIGRVEISGKPLIPLLQYSREMACLLNKSESARGRFGAVTAGPRVTRPHPLVPQWCSSCPLGGR